MTDAENRPSLAPDLNQLLQRMAVHSQLVKAPPPTETERLVTEEPQPSQSDETETDEQDAWAWLRKAADALLLSRDESEPGDPEQAEPPAERPRPETTAPVVRAQRVTENVVPPAEPEAEPAQQQLEWPSRPADDQASRDDAEPEEESAAPGETIDLAGDEAGQTAEVARPSPPDDNQPIWGEAELEEESAAPGETVGLTGDEADQVAEVVWPSLLDHNQPSWGEAELEEEAAEPGETVGLAGDEAGQVAEVVWPSLLDDNQTSLGESEPDEDAAESGETVGLAGDEAGQAAAVAWPSLPDESQSGWEAGPEEAAAEPGETIHLTASQAGQSFGAGWSSRPDADSLASQEETPIELAQVHTEEAVPVRAQVFPSPASAPAVERMPLRPVPIRPAATAPTRPPHSSKHGKWAIYTVLVLLAVAIGLLRQTYLSSGRSLPFSPSLPARAPAAEPADTTQPSAAALKPSAQPAAVTFATVRGPRTEEQLRFELKQAGYPFSGSTDPRDLVAAYDATARGEAAPLAQRFVAGTPAGAQPGSAPASWLDPAPSGAWRGETGAAIRADFVGAAGGAGHEAQAQMDWYREHVVEADQDGF